MALATNESAILLISESYSLPLQTQVCKGSRYGLLYLIVAHLQAYRNLKQKQLDYYPAIAMYVLHTICDQILENLPSVHTFK